MAKTETPPETAPSAPPNRQARRHPTSPPPLNIDDRLLAVNEVAEYLGTHRAWVYRAMRDGTLPYVTVGTRRRVRMSDLKSYLDLAS